MKCQFDKVEEMLERYRSMYTALSETEKPLESTKKKYRTFESESPIRPTVPHSVIAHIIRDAHKFPSYNDMNFKYTKKRNKMIVKVPQWDANATLGAFRVKEKTRKPLTNPNSPTSRRARGLCFGNLQFLGQRICRGEPGISDADMKRVDRQINRKAKHWCREEHLVTDNYHQLVDHATFKRKPGFKHKLI